MKRVRFRLAELLKEKHIKQGELVAALDISHNTVKAYYHNHVLRPDLEIIARMCEYLDCELSDLLVLEDVPERVS